MPVPDTANDKRLPVTLLSGFLGSGKTTLLSYILKSKDHGLRCAVIVNDMGALNIDASLIKNHKLTQKEEKVVQMQNGCICCTLRADLLEEVANLAEMGSFDYLIIESSGISEPIQVAETFTPEFAESIDGTSLEEIEESLPTDDGSTPEARKKLAKLIAEGGLSKVAKLDTCVSMVDCTTFMDDFDTTDFLTDRHGQDVDPEDERNITDLLTDQIEFANVILLNKTDMVNKDQLAKIENLVKTLNPTAKILQTTYSKVDLKEILNTNLFDFATAATGAGWLQSLRENTLMEITDAKGNKKMVPKPETLEYGISSFVYTARRPFHPHRLWDVLSSPFCIIQNAEEEEEEEDEDEDGEGEDEAEDVEMDEDKLKAQRLEEMKAEKEALDLPSKLKFKKESPVWKGVLRSKGWIWIATRPNLHGEWSQAGVMCTIEGGGPWMCEVPEDQWPGGGDQETIDAIKLDFMGEWGDRRQELVFIGQELDQNLIRKTMDETLLTDDEWAKWEKIMKSKKLSAEKKAEKLFNAFDDGWEAWAEPMEEDDEEEINGHSHAGHSHAAAPRKKAKIASE
ncbi:uncharacterized protein I303_107106 [Kwoniella dejecticola CBS 10117]|uniref:Cobalamin synthesis protein n=1 Tax=Kwoniella dejecticola CBS 10117 TaxID=1296121 RepID=A0A1A5ZYR7_9TREE|nr:cobalamin synthesis protein [Kwoniella dejecticola CBS 10117]OBR82950.1 cobalamin synthesis protein [Kwoniella dejecticola CBS 10117]